MKRRDFFRSAASGSFALWAGLGVRGLHSLAQGRSATRKILIAGGNFNTPFIRYMAALTGKTRPKLLYLPTASADSQAGTIEWYRHCSPLNVEALDQESFIES